MAGFLAAADPGWVADLQSSGDLFDDAHARGDAIAMAVAAEMRARAIPTDKLGDDVRTASHMREAAERAATENILTILAARKLPRTRGAVGGRVLKTLEFAKGEATKATVSFRGGETAIVFVEGASGKPFYLRIEHDEEILCEDRSDHWRKLCRFIPSENVDATLFFDWAAPGDYLLVTN